MQVQVDGTLPWDPMNLWLKSTAKATSAGSFQLSLSLYDWTAGAYDASLTTTSALSTQNSALECIAKGDVTRFVRPSDRAVRAALKARQTGPASILLWCASFDQAAWEAVPLP